MIPKLDETEIEFSRAMIRLINAGARYLEAFDVLTPEHDEYRPLFLIVPDGGKPIASYRGWIGDALENGLHILGKETLDFIKSKPDYKSIVYSKELRANIICVRMEEGDRPVPLKVAAPPAPAPLPAQPQPTAGAANLDDIPF